MENITIQDCLDMAEKGYEIYIENGRLMISKNEGEYKYEKN